MRQLAKHHPCFKQGRCVGLFGIFELQKNSKGDWLVGYNGGSHPAVEKFKKALVENGLITMARWSQVYFFKFAFVNLLQVYCNPPLVITEEQLRESFAIIDKCLSVVDEAFEK